MLLVRPKYWISVVLLTLVTVLSIGARAASQDEVDGRKIKNKVQPIYPDLAKRMNVTGSVKVEVVVAPNGTIKSTKVIGGHPLLVEPSLDAVKKWRFEPGNGDTTTTVIFNFNNN